MDTLGIGRYAKVKLSQDKDTHKKYAAKIIREPNNQAELKQVLKEAECLVRLRSAENIIKIVQINGKGRYLNKFGKSRQVIYFLFELAELGDLYDFIAHSPQFSENLGLTFFKQIVKAVEICHNNAVAHGDIKVENILVNENYQILLADFGSAEDVICEMRDQLQKWGSEEYSAPELLRMFDTNKICDIDLIKADVFSLGVVAFVMHLGCPPWKSARESDQYFNTFIFDKERF